MALFTCLSFLIPPSCQKPKSDQDPLLNVDNISPSLSSKKGKPAATVGKVRDVDGNWYKTMKIGNQWWMAENLKTTKYHNRELIGTTNPPTKNILGDCEPRYQWAYNGIESYVATWGRYYTWYAITDPRGVCPSGWHVSTDEDWTILINAVGGVSEADKLKATTLWYDPNHYNTDEFGFRVIPASTRSGGGVFGTLGGIGSTAYFWTTAVYSPIPNSAVTIGFTNTLTKIEIAYSSMADGLSVRCVKDN